MNWLSEIGLITGREIKKNFRSLKGIILLIISLLGGSGVALIHAWLAKQKLVEGMSPEEVQMTFMKGLQQAGFPDDIAEYVSHAPPTLYLMMWGTIWLTPLMIAVIGFDGISGELQNRTVRYWNVRTRRWAYYVGKVLGMWAVIAVFTLMIHLAVWCVCAAFAIAPWSMIFKWGFRLYAVTVPIAGAWCGISQLVSSNFRVPILSLLTTCVVFFLLWVLKGIGLIWHDTMDALTYVYPNTYDEKLLSPHPNQVLGGIAALLTFMILTTAVGSFIFEKRDV